MDTQIAFEDILNNQIPMNEEFWLNVREEDLAAPKLRIRLIYQQDQIYRLKNEVDYYENDLRENVGILSQVRAFIQQLRTPFGYLKYDIDQANYQIAQEEEKEKAAEEHGDHPYFAQEKNAEK